MGYPEVFEKQACNSVASQSLGDLSKLEKHFATASIRATEQLRENTSPSETTGWEELFILA